ncbi:hypothetical protein KK090_12120 [Curtobacterium flaccumfaciens pv. poinsettiae]|uniref:hypothetical protein n=1 Tax=Curtobacterium poinsettiae TaxID=159612 RepID=UPI001BE0B02B|nr:hypothetical protein [Curtobacterium flaccumfaciens]MBT1620002.1 hypothetical protein [Curtobacterium flaccumfaciens pv. poinsettiae]
MPQTSLGRTKYPDQAEIVSADPLFDWIDRRFLRADPFAFGNEENFRQFALACSSSFGVDPNGVFCTGSGAIGLSLNPEKVADGQLKEFSETSDLDIALISEVHFESAWRNLREKSHPALVPEAEPSLRDALEAQRVRFFDGAILANRLAPYLEFGADWLTKNVQIEESAAIALNREVSVHYWIYRDYWSVRSYVANSILECRSLLL